MKTHRTLALASFALLAFLRLRAQESPDDRFATVKSWAGTLEVRATASGTVTVPFTGSVAYSIDRHLTYPFTLGGPGSPIGWFTCSTAGSHGTIDDVYVTHYDRIGCENTLRHYASGPLNSPPPDPNGTPEWPCTLNGFQLQIIPIPFAGTYTSWGFFDGIQGHANENDQCPAVDLTSDMDFNFLEGDNGAICSGIGCLDLPADGFHIEKRWAYDHAKSTQAGLVDVHYDVHLDLVGCGEELEVVVNVLDYDEWRPEGAKSEDEEGNRLVVQARLQGRGGCPTGIKASRFIFELLDVSSEPGVCMNYPRTSSTTGKPDLAFLGNLHGAPWEAFTLPADRLTTETGSYEESPRASISSFDWGGHAALKVTAEFDDDPIPPIVGHLAGDAAMTVIRIPKRAEGSKIADVWKDAESVAGLADTDDAETDPPGDGHDGDGLFLYEEYRGFYEGADDHHISGKPKKKEIFIAPKVDAAAGIELFRKITGLEVHGKLLQSQLDDDRTVNFQRSDEVGNDTDQHGLVIDKSAAGSGLLGFADGGPGLPAFVQRVLINSVITPRTVDAIVGGNSATVTQRAFVIAHELLHGCNVFHHGDLDNRADFIATSKEGRLVYALAIDDRVELFAEGACGAKAPVVPPNPNAHLRNVFIAFKGGQHSGEQSCLMRYNLARYYASATLDFVWRHDSEEPPGLGICSATAGTGVNADDHCPESRYGASSVGCCGKQICVNDRQNHTPKVAPSQPCGPSGAGGEVAGAPPDGGGAAGDAPPVVSLALDDERAAVAHRGWPLLVTLQVIPPGFGGDPAGEDFVVAGAAGSWTSSLQLRLRKDGADAALWPLSPLATGAPARLELGPQDVGVAAWWIRPEDSAQIAPGEYSLEAVLDTTSAADGWTGIAAAEPVRITVVAEPAPLDAELEAEKALAFSRFYAGEKRYTDALGVVDALLVKQPSNVAAFEFRGEILELSGNDAAALEALEAAVDAFYAANPTAEEPPVELLKSVDALQARLFLGGAPGETRFRRGDVNADGLVNISDPITTLGYLFLGSPKSLACAKSADSDDTGTLNLTDAVYLLVYLFTGGAAPLAPGATCGLDPTADALECSTHPPCGA